MKRAPAQAAVAEPSFAESMIWWALQGALVAVALVTSRGENVYRLPKQLLLEATGIVIFAACAIQTLLQPERGILRRLARHRLPVAVTCCAVGWTLITTATSTQKSLSLATVIWVTSCAAFFLAAVALLERRGVHALFLPLIAAVINSLVAIAQRLEIWNPFVFPENTPLRLRTTAFLGNPNDMGAYLLVPAMATIVLGIVNRGWGRAANAGAAAVIGAGLLASETISAFIAFGVFIAVLALRISRRAAAAVALVILLAAIAAFALDTKIAQRVTDIVSHLRSGNVQAATSFRLQASLTAWQMFLDHPLVGVGPGCFGFSYLPRYVLLFRTHPEFLDVIGNFGDAHNDHLQILATTGLPGYALFLCALWQWARRGSGHQTAGDARRCFARVFAFPAAAGFAVLAMAQFPLELAGPTSVILYFAAVTVSWSDSA